MWRYCQASPDAQAERPQRPFVEGDGARIAGIINKIRHEYWIGKQSGKSVNFESIKNTILDEQRLEQKKRNFYSSVISTYITWSNSGTPEAAKSQLPDLEAFVRHLKSGD